jgi:hypothetical protein
MAVSAARSSTAGAAAAVDGAAAGLPGQLQVQQWELLCGRCSNRRCCHWSYRGAKTQLYPNITD